jgi:hypothetical protein
MKHSRQLFAEHAGDKEFMLTMGDHNSVRGRAIVKHVVDYFCKAFCLGPKLPALNHMPLRNITNVLVCSPWCRTPPPVCAGADVKHDVLPGWVLSHMPLAEKSFETGSNVQLEMAEASERLSERLHLPLPKTQHFPSTIRDSQDESLKNEDRTPRSTPRTPTRAPCAPSGDIESEVITPPALEFPVCPQAGRSCGGRQRRRARGYALKSQQSWDSCDLENMMSFCEEFSGFEITKSPQRLALEQDSVVAEKQDVPAPLEDLGSETCFSSSFDKLYDQSFREAQHECHRQDLVIDDIQLQEVQDVYPSLSPAFLVPQRPQAPHRSKQTPLLRHVSLTCCGDLAATMFGTCLRSSKACESTASRPCWIVSV